MPLRIYLPGKQRISMLAQWCIDALVIIFPASLLTMDRADSLTLAALAFAGLYIYLRHSRNLEFNNQERLLLGAFAGVFAVACAAYLFGDQTDIGFRMLGRDLRFFLFIPVYIVFRFIPPRRRTVFIGIALGSIVTGAYALVEHFHSGVERVEGVSGSIAFGDIALVTAVSSLGLPLAFAGMAYRKYLYWLAGSAIVCGLIASFLSGTRGGWVALPVLAVLVFLTIAHISIRHLWRYAIGLLLLISISTLLVPGSILISRASDALNQMQIFYRFRELAHQGDVKTGCQDDADILNGIVSVMKFYGLSHELSAKVVNDRVVLHHSSPGNDCKPGYVIDISNTSSKDSLSFSIPRSVMSVYGFQKLEFVVKGNGMLSLYNGTGRSVSFSNDHEYSQITLIDSTPVSDNEPPVPWPIFTLAPHAQISFVPYSLYPGEYSNFYALGPVGARLELWTAAWILFRSHPWLGTGTGAFMESVHPFVKQDYIAPHIAVYDHPHSDYLNFMAGEGLLGLVAFLLVILYPMRIYLNALFYSGESSVRSAGLCGLLMVSGIVIFSFTESLFVHSIVIGWYVIMTALFCALIRTYSTDHVTH